MYVDSTGNSSMIIIILPQEKKGVGKYVGAFNNKHCLPTTKVYSSGQPLSFFSKGTNFLGTSSNILNVLPLMLDDSRFE